jgi:hypothetical protein
MSEQLLLVKSGVAAPTEPRASTLRGHAEYCFAGQPAPSPGYFDGDVLPCVCGAEGTVLEALWKVAQFQAAQDIGVPDFALTGIEAMDNPAQTASLPALMCRRSGNDEAECRFVGMRST